MVYVLLVLVLFAQVATFVRVGHLLRDQTSQARRLHRTVTALPPCQWQPPVSDANGFSGVSIENSVHDMVRELRRRNEDG